MICDMTNEAYHSDYEWHTRSMLETYRLNTDQYLACYVDKTMQAYGASTRPMRRGSELHGAALEGEEPDEFKEEVGAMLKALRHHGKACELLWGVEGMNEKVVKQIWPTPFGGLKVKVRPDRLLPLPAPMIVELKTAANTAPSAFLASVTRYGYHRQAAMYQDICEKELDAQPELVYVVVKNAPPWNVRCYQLKTDLLERGRQEWRSTASDLAQSLSTNVWSIQPVEILEVAARRKK